MLCKVRISFQIATVAVLMGAVFLIAPHAARAAASPFLRYPFYGSASIFSLFDHQYPLYTAEGGGYANTLVASDGSTRNNAVNGSCTGGYSCYSGHAAYDYQESWQPALAAAGGSVTQATWNSATDHSFGCGLYVKLTHTSVSPNYQTLYCHLSAMLVQAGEVVVQTQQVGTSGTTGDWGTVRHLHFEVRVQNAGGSWKPTDPYGWSGTYTDPWQIYGSGSSAGVQSTYLWVNNPVNTAPGNYGSFILEDSTTNNSTFMKWCAADPNGTNCPYWWGVNSGSGGHMFYTYANGTTVDYQAKWTPGSNISSNGIYEVYVWIPSNYATSGAVRYTVYYWNGNKTIIVDQNYTYNQWISLGTYYFLQGTGYLKVVDAAYFSGYTDPTDKMVGVDAVRFIRRNP